jgi:hypothetical protein
MQNGKCGNAVIFGFEWSNIHPDIKRITGAPKAISYCLEGSMITELKDGRSIEIKKGLSYHVEDENYPHRSSTETGATLFIVD